MNPLTQIRNTQKASKFEVAQGLSEGASWHARYKHSAYVFAGGLPYDLTEGDVLAIFAQYGELIDVNLVKDKDTGEPHSWFQSCATSHPASNRSPAATIPLLHQTLCRYFPLNFCMRKQFLLHRLNAAWQCAGKPRGFAFVAYEDQRSTTLAVDNLSGTRITGRIIRVEHVDSYKRKKAEA